jgi:hypothetical protein
VVELAANLLRSVPTLVAVASKMSADSQKSSKVARFTGRRRDQIFYTGLAVLAAAIVFAGFARTFYLRSLFGTSSLTPFLLLHGFVFTSWLVLLVVQTTLVAAKRTYAHRRLGVAGGVLAALMFVGGPAVAIQAARRGSAPPGFLPLSFLAVPLGDIFVFSMLVAGGFLYRRQPEFHKRLMLLATIAIPPPAIARLPFAFIREAGPLAYFGLTDLVLLGCVLYDVVAHQCLHNAYLLGGLVLIASQPLRLAIGRTWTWLAFARWLTR